MVEVIKTISTVFVPQIVMSPPPAVLKKNSGVQVREEEVEEDVVEEEDVALNQEEQDVGLPLDQVEIEVETETPMIADITMGQTAELMLTMLFVISQEGINPDAVTCAMMWPPRTSRDKARKSQSLQLIKLL
jgi:hypothetical protein